MVSSGISGLTRTCNQKFRNMKVLLPMGPSDSIPNDHEIDFSVVFGPIPVEPSVEINGLASNNFVPRRASDGKNYDSPLVLRNRSHALVGPSQITQLLQHTSLETNSLRDLGACSTVKTEVQQEKTRSNDAAEKDNQTKEVSGVGLEDFEVLKLVGRGAFGKVFQVRKRDTSEIFAMKVMRKDKIIEKNHAAYMKAERDILTKIDHPFIVRLRYSFQTKYRLYLVLDFVNGGHLFFQLYHEGLFREDLARIYAAEIVSAVSHLHANGIMHRDLKPENILMDADGHVLLTDFGLAKEFNGNDRSNSLCGTVEYMAPEIITGKGHDKAADWWSVGILLFEMLTGNPPFVGGNRDKIQQRIVKEKMKLPFYLSAQAHSLLKGLLQKEASKRLGNGPGGSNDIKNHKWFKSINWKKLEAREIQPSFRPNVADQLCIANFDKKLTSMPLLDSPVASPVAGDDVFVNFSYVRPSTFLQKQSLLQS
ncbi:serine/threonine-protein kinase AtPK2/AtPK19-like [Phalaenopsis equestris]|uniref:serine/threonine-protein kinase AtPK2/AtPK19-like n=1 Tax=Phalaenopsis equestris TaxID=78828 RepID=UPI0009E5F838|nr:serine/threonine-protein kinase AtPK2/AtPK19-like [Phalaenopsis equestris]XP_020590065.1 serine/threonine-protein kinase AtPK2/AtPK19-like [Phalaenopsis equestris]